MAEGGVAGGIGYGAGHLTENAVNTELNNPDGSTPSVGGAVVAIGAGVLGQTVGQVAAAGFNVATRQTGTTLGTFLSSLDSAEPSTAQSLFVGASTSGFVSGFLDVGFGEMSDYSASSPYCGDLDNLPLAEDYSYEGDVSGE